MNFYSNGKLLLTAEYLVLDGAKALALPTKYGQDLEVKQIQEAKLIWASFTSTNTCWFEAVFCLKKMRLERATFTSKVNGSAETIAETLLDILKVAKQMNPNFLTATQGFLVTTTLTFPRDWGLGTSSTLINSIANWAKVDAFKLLWNSFKGSGYDIACAKHNTPILYQKENQNPIVTQVTFNPVFKDNLFFVHLNKKQNSKDGIAAYRANTANLTQDITTVSELSNAFLNATKLTDFEDLIEEHEQLISKVIQLKPVKQILFADYFGAVKSLGAWGGDFVLATGNETTTAYFKNKGYHTVLPYSKLIL